MPRIPAVALLLAAAVAAPRVARAADLFEIQVYEGDLDTPGHFGLELHSNYTIRGNRSPEHAGQVAPDRVGRLTLEPSYGVTDWLELGAYVQGFAGPAGTFEYGGWKGRVKLVVPERLGSPLRLGLNVEVGRVPVAVERDGWANEFRPIVGWSAGRLSITVNPIFGYALTGADRFRVELEPSVKAHWNTNAGFALGAEYYAGLGFAGGLASRAEQEHLAFATFDLVEPVGRDGAKSPWELNLGVGAGLTEATPQHAIVKMIVGREF
jgi:hypothetical protein